jgi:hypothetical protein
MYYAQLTRKQKRIIEKDIETLFTPAALLGTSKLEEIKKLDVLHPTVRIGRGVMFLSNAGVSAVRRIGDALSTLPTFKGSVSTSEIHNEILKNYNSWITRSLQPTGEELTQEVGDVLVAKVREYEFLALIEGIDLGDQDVVDFGTFRIQRHDRALLEKVKFGGNLTLDPIYDQFKDHLWIITRCKGSPDVARKQFEEKIRLATGVLGICGAVLYRGAIWRTCVRALVSPFEHRSAVSQLSWEVGGENPSILRSWGTEQPLRIDSETITRLKRDYHLQQLCSLLERSARSELQDAIVRSTYWFADAYKDRNPTMQFVKLWSCAESFFAIEKDGITELNARGIATVLTFAGYRVVETGEYASFKKRLKKMYDSRSEAIHEGRFGHIELSDLSDFSRWMAWLILSMFSLSERGYKTLRKIHEQNSRLDRLSNSSNTDRTRPFPMVSR